MLCFFLCGNIKEKQTMGTILGLFFLIIIDKIVFTSTTMIPEDIEILDGYKIDETSEYDPANTFLEAESLRNFALSKAIRNRRSPIYRILESPGLLSHFHIENFDSLKDSQPTPAPKRQKRSENSSINNESEKEETTEKDVILQPSNLPVAEKQVMEPAEYYNRKGGWNVQSFNTDYTKNQSPDDDGDPTPEASNNEGIKGRTPRVNFITQPKKGIDEFKERSISPKYAGSAVPLSTRYERIQAPPYSSYSPYSDLYPSRSYDPYLRRYDRYDDQYTRYDPYYEDYYLYRRRFDPYDSYSPRTPMQPDPYYDYPDRRYDVPEPRDYRPIYSNDLYYDRPPSSHERNNRRIIYYAHLPEVVRSPPSIDLTYSHGRDHRYDSYYSSSPTGGSTSGAYQHPDNSNSKDNYGFIKREKKDHRNYPPYQKTSTSNTKQDP